MRVSEEVFQIDPTSVRDIGQAVVNSAMAEQSSTDPLALDNFHTDLTHALSELPPSLTAVLTTFNTKFYTYYTDVLTQRGDIGKILLNTATAAEQQEVRNINMFTDIPPEVMA